MCGVDWSSLFAEGWFDSIASLSCPKMLLEWRTNEYSSAIVSRCFLCCTKVLSLVLPVLSEERDAELVSPSISTEDFLTFVSSVASDFRYSEEDRCVELMTMVSW